MLRLRVHVDGRGDDKRAHVLSRPEVRPHLQTLRRRRSVSHGMAVVVVHREVVHSREVGTCTTVVRALDPHRWTERTSFE